MEEIELVQLDVKRVRIGIEFKCLVFVTDTKFRHRLQADMGEKISVITTEDKLTKNVILEITLLDFNQIAYHNTNLTVEEYPLFSMINKGELVTWMVGYDGDELIHSNTPLRSLVH